MPRPALETVTTSAGRSLRIRVVAVGQHFGHRAQLLARNGRVLAETKIVPYGMRANAVEAARALAERM